MYNLLRKRLPLAAAKAAPQSAPRRDPMRDEGAGLELPHPRGLSLRRARGMMGEVRGPSAFFHEQILVF